MSLLLERTITEAGRYILDNQFEIYSNLEEIYEDPKYRSRIEESKNIGVSVSESPARTLQDYLFRSTLFLRIFIRMESKYKSVGEMHDIHRSKWAPVIASDALTHSSWQESWFNG